MLNILDRSRIIILSSVDARKQPTMQCPTCQTEARKFGRDRYGNQRWQCMGCRKTWSDRPAELLDDMRLPLDKAVLCLKLLTEGNSVRATSRVSGVAKNTILALLVCVGEK